LTKRAADADLLVMVRLISAALAVLICWSPKGDTSHQFQTLWPRGRRTPTSWSWCVWSVRR